VTRVTCAAVLCSTCHNRAAELFVNTEFHMAVNRGSVDSERGPSMRLDLPSCLLHDAERNLSAIVKFLV